MAPDHASSGQHTWYEADHDKLLATQFTNRVLHYKVKWIGDHVPSWVPAQDVSPLLITEYHKYYTKQVCRHKGTQLTCFRYKLYVLIHITSSQGMLLLHSWPECSVVQCLLFVLFIHFHYTQPLYQGWSLRCPCAQPPPCLHMSILIFTHTTFFLIQALVTPIASDLLLVPVSVISSLSILLIIMRLLMCSQGAN